MCNKEPVGEITANLQPVLKAGSNPNTVLLFIGGCINKFFKFVPKFLMALSSATSVKSALISLSMLGIINLFKASVILVFNSSVVSLLFL